MKKMKRMLAMLLCLVTMFAMSATVSAAEQKDPDPTYEVKIETAANHTYRIYQLATGDVSEDGKTLSNIKVGANAKEGTTVDQIVALTGKSEAELGKAAFELVDTGEAFKYIKADGTTSDGTVVGDGNSFSVTLPGGYYVITDSYTNGSAAEGDSLSRYMVNLVKDTTVTPKTITVTPDKDIVKDDGTLTDDNDVSIGDTVTYRLSGTIPDMEGYNAFKYVFSDTLSAGLTVSVKEGDTFTGYIADKDADSNSFTKLQEDGTDITVTFEVTEVKKNNDGTTTVRFAMRDAKNGCTGYAGKHVYMDYTATVNKDAAIENANDNSVKIEFSNDPTKVYDGEPEFTGDEPKGETADKTVYVYTTKLTIAKTDGEGKKLTGAEFELTGTGVNVGYVTGQEFVASDAAGDSVDETVYYKLADGAFTTTEPSDDTANRYESKVNGSWPTYKLINVDKEQYTTAQTTAKAFVDEDGKVVFTGLGAGTYTLTEVTTPNGYNTIKPITFTVTWTKEDGFTVAIAADSENKDVEITAENGILATTVINEKGTLLPDTGGIGTTIFYVIGGILMVGAGVLLLTRKRAAR